MYVALPGFVMLLSELFIIYFAAAAPFGVSRFLSERAAGRRTRNALLKAAGVAAVWPYASLPALLRRLRARACETPGGGEAHAPEAHGVERLTRAAVNSLREVEDILASVGALEDAGARHALYAARECVERYAGLALACAWTDAEAGPTPREMELCRIAGRAGDDLLVAGRCVHRRNVTRLFAHRERARAELVRALAEVRQIAEGAHARARVHAFEGRACDAEAGRMSAARSEVFSPALSNAFSKVVELLALFGDEATEGGVYRLVAEAGESAHHAESRKAAAARAAAQEGGESCTTPAVPTAFATQRLRT